MHALSFGEPQGAWLRIAAHKWRVVGAMRTPSLAAARAVKHSCSVVRAFLAMANAACLGPPCSPVAKSAATDAPGLSAATSSTGGAVSSSRLRSAEGPRRQDPQRLHTNVQIFATTRRQSVSLIVPRPWCAGPTSDYVGAMPARSRKSLATSAQHAAKKIKQVHAARRAFVDEPERGRRPHAMHGRRAR